MAGVLKLTRSHGHQNYGPQLLGCSQGALELKATHESCRKWGSARVWFGLPETHGVTSIYDINPKSTCLIMIINHSGHAPSPFLHLLHAMSTCET